MSRPDDARASPASQPSTSDQAPSPPAATVPPPLAAVPLPTGADGKLAKRQLKKMQAAHDKRGRGKRRAVEVGTRRRLGAAASRPA
jgi:hypothetical protein